MNEEIYVGQCSAQSCSYNTYWPLDFHRSIVAILSDQNVPKQYFQLAKANHWSTSRRKHGPFQCHLPKLNVVRLTTMDSNTPHTTWQNCRQRTTCFHGFSVVTSITKVSIFLPVFTLVESKNSLHNISCNMELHQVKWSTSLITRTPLHTPLISIVFQAALRS